MWKEFSASDSHWVTAIVQQAMLNNLNKQKFPSYFYSSFLNQTKIFYFCLSLTKVQADTENNRLIKSKMKFTFTWIQMAQTHISVVKVRMNSFSMLICTLYGFICKSWASCVRWAAAEPHNLLLTFSKTRQPGLWTIWSFQLIIKWQYEFHSTGLSFGWLKSTRDHDYGEKNAPFI